MVSEKTSLLGGTSSEADLLPAPAAGRRKERSAPRSFRIAVIVILSLLALRVLLVFNYVHSGLWHSHPEIVEDFNLRRARRLLSRYPLIDGHNDLLYLLRYKFDNEIYNSTFREDFEVGGLPGHVDIPRIEEGQLGGAFWSAFVGCPANVTDFSDANYAIAVRETVEQLDLFARLTALYPALFTPVSTAADARVAFHRDHHLISPIGIEGLHQIGNSLSTLRLYHALGVRYATLTWNCHNAYADAAVISDASGSRASSPLWHGVSPAGHELVWEMNRLGMLVDISHVSADTMRDVLAGPDSVSLSAPERLAAAKARRWTGSLAPPIFSHSSAHAVCPHPRNVPDDVLRLVKARDGLVMINFAPDFISCRTGDAPSGLPDYVDETNTLEHVVRHMRHIGDGIGWRHVGIGSDFDGIPSTPRGLEGVDKFPDLVAELLRQGVREREVADVLGGNLLRVWGEADRISEEMRREGWLPAEDEI